jgi:hypothetical protein
MKYINLSDSNYLKKFTIWTKLDLSYYVTDIKLRLIDYLSLTNNLTLNKYKLKFVYYDEDIIDEELGIIINFDENSLLISSDKYSFEDSIYILSKITFVDILFVNNLKYDHCNIESINYNSIDLNIIHDELSLLIKHLYSARYPVDCESLLVILGNIKMYIKDNILFSENYIDEDTLLPLALVSKLYLSYDNYQRFGKIVITGN